MEITVTSVWFYRKGKYDSEQKIATATVEINGLFKICNLALIKNDERFEVSLPKIRASGNSDNVVFFYNREDIDHIRVEVIKQYLFLKSIGKWEEPQAV